jgi:hypothetical protein
MTSKRTVQLSACGVPSSFDYSLEHNLVAVSSSSDLSFYRLDDLGTPSQVIAYEQPVQCTFTKFQHGGKGLVTCLRDGVVSVWDPKQSVKCMVDFIPDSKGIQDISWAPHSSDTLSTVSSYGNLTLWDVRTALRPTHDLIIGKRCGKVDWCPHNPSLMAATCEDNYILVWDIRMMPPTQGSLASNSHETEDQQVHVIESEERILNFAWSAIHTAIFTTTENCGLDVWSLSPCEDNSFDSQRVSTMRSSLVNDRTKLLPGAYGERLALLHHRPRTGESAVYMRKYLDPEGHLRSVQTGDGAYGASCESPRLDLEHSVPDPFVKFGTSKSRILDMLWMNGPTAAGCSHPDSRDLDMMLLNEEGLLQVLHVPSLSRGSKYGRLSVTPSNYFNKRSSAHFSDLSASLRYGSRIGRPGTGLGGSYERLDVLSEDDLTKAGSRGNSTANLLRLQDSTPTGTFKRYSFGARTFSNATSTALANPQLMMVGPVTFQSLLEDDLIALEYGINHGYLEGWRIGRIDQFARRIYLELLIPNIDSNIITNKHSNASFTSYYRNEDLFAFYQQRRLSSVRVVELIITFPVKFVDFWIPSFMIENKSGLAVRHCTLRITFTFRCNRCFPCCVCTVQPGVAVRPDH